MKERYRLGVDLGSTSLGWCMLKLDDNNDPTGIINMGVRIFPDGREMKSHEPLAVKRRGYRGQRRNLDRYLERIRALISYLLENGFLPEDERHRNEVFKINPYHLRTKALDEQLSPAEFARALIHLAKRRGFRSNRKIQSDKTTKITEGIENLRKQLDETGARTLGEYMWELYNKNPDHPNQKTLKKRGVEAYPHKMGHHIDQPIKFRYEKTYANPIFPTRQMVEHEFNAVWHAQADFSDIYTEEHRQKIHEIIFFQRPLKPAQQGRCEFEPDELRAPKAHPLFQEFRILQNLNNMKEVDLFQGTSSCLSPEHHDKLYALLHAKKEVEFKAMRKALWGKEADDHGFNLETEKTKKLPGDQTSAVFNKKDNADLKPVWDAWTDELKSSLIEILISDMDDVQKVEEMATLGLEEDIIDRMLDLNFPDGYASVSLKAIKKILPFLRQKLVLSEACREAGYDHSLEYSGEIYDQGDLPYYGEVLKQEVTKLTRNSGDEEADVHGKINNPTVHVALNQLWKLVNSLSLKYGAPAQVVLELGKEARMSAEKRKNLIKAMNDNEKLNDEIRAFLTEHHQPINHNNMLRVKLWRELGKNEIDRRCVYTGDQISVSDLFSHKIEIDHILPKSRTYDDTTANKVLCAARANRAKGEKTPWEAWHDSPGEYKWEDILARSSRLARDSQKWRFRSDAMERFEDEGELLKRMLNDTRYMSRVAMKYMWYVCGNSNVWTVTGKHTGLLRKKWGLNAVFEGQVREKDRTDHRHHAIDAFVIALTSRSMVKKMADNIKQAKGRLIEGIDLPYPQFDHQEFQNRIHNIAVSYKPDQINADKLAKRNQTGGALVKETAYGYAGPDPDSPKYHLYTIRKAVSELTRKDIKNVVQADLRNELEQLASKFPDDDFKVEIKKWAASNNIKKVKLALSKNPAVMVPIRDKNGKAFKYMDSGENLFADIYLSTPTDPNCKWGIEIVGSYYAQRPGFVPQWKKDHPKGKKIMRVFKNDIIALDGPDGKRELRRVRKMTNSKLYLRPINIAKKPQVDSTGKQVSEDKGEAFVMSTLQDLNARKAGIDIIGRVFDPIVNEQ